MDAGLSGPQYVVSDGRGNLYFNDVGVASGIRKVDANGVIKTVAGTGHDIWGMREMAVDNAGNLYFSQYNSNVVYKLDASGAITVVAGNFSAGFAGDGGPATQARISGPRGLAVDNDGNLYIADTRNNRIRKVDPQGIITTVAGDGTLHSGDGGPAIEAGISPFGLAVDRAGNLYIAEPSFNCMRKIDAGGIITRVAGSVAPGFSGDGGAATLAKLNAPYGVAVDPAGNLYIADTKNNRIRMVDTNGIITTVAGTGTFSHGGDGGLPTLATLRFPKSIVVDHAGDLYVPDVGSGRYGYGSVDPYKLDLGTGRIRKISRGGTAVAGGILFAEESGLGYLMTNSGLHQSTLDIETGGILRTFDYDPVGKLIFITDRFGNRTSIERDAAGIANAIISPDGVRTDLTIDPSNHLTRITYPDTSHYDFEYTSGGLLTFKTEPNGNRFEHRFDQETGRLTEVLDEEGGNWRYERAEQSDGDILTTSTTGEGSTTSYLDHRDSAGAFTSEITGPTGGVTLFSQSADKLNAAKNLACGLGLAFDYTPDPRYGFRYLKQRTESSPSGLARLTQKERAYEDTDSNGQPDRLTEKVTVNGRVSTFITDTLQSRKTLTSAEGRTVTLRYDPATLLTASVSVPGLQDTILGYDGRGRLTSVAYNTRQTTFVYDDRGNLSSVTDPLHHTTSYTYDAAGRVSGVERKDGTELAFTYDPNGNLTVLATPAHVDHSFGYNRVNLSSSYATPLSGSYTYLYDKEKHLTQIRLASGKEINNFYEAGRLARTDTPEGSVLYDYSCSSKLKSVSRGGETIHYTYDGLLLKSDQSTGTLNRTLSYVYNSDFNVANLAYAGGSVDFAYDKDGLLTGAGAFTVGRNAGNGLPETVGDGTFSLNRTFNGYGEIESEAYAAGTVDLPSYSLLRDDAGQIVAKTEIIGSTVTAEYVYTYDDMGRLLTVEKDGTLVEGYLYGPSGARISETNALRGISREMTYSDEDHLLTAGDTSYEYDLDGFLTTKTVGGRVTGYTYSSRGNLLSVTLPGGRIIEYVLDPLGRRTAKKVNGTVSEKYLWQGMTRLLAVYDGNDNITVRFQYADARTPVAMTRAGATYYLVHDQVGSLRAVTDAAGAIAKRMEYDSFGNILTDTNPAFTVPFGFAGGLYDPDTGLVRFGYRDYDPDVGRWTAKDPILFQGGDTDLYGYVQNDPVNQIDPYGLAGWNTVGKFLAKQFGKLIGKDLSDKIGLSESEIAYPEYEREADEYRASYERQKEMVDEAAKKWNEEIEKEKSEEPKACFEGF